MEWNWKEYNKKKHQFKSYYCFGCKQVKPCGVLTSLSSDWQSYCCPCYFQKKQTETQEHSDYQLVYQQRVKEKKEHDRQLLLLRDYLGCRDCRSKEVDAYCLYSESWLVCQPCLVKKEGGSSSPISFLEKVKWYKKQWKLDLKEWLKEFSQLPVNKNCAEKWLKDKNHLNNCQCLEKEALKLVEMFSNSLKEYQEKLKECKCVKSEKFRVSDDDYAWCEICEGTIYAASKKRVIKNRNDPRFWGLSIKEKVLCLECLKKFREKMPVSKKYMLNKYLKRGY
jgi:hypothetical protein